jgi:hypothetical protein
MKLLTVLGLATLGVFANASPVAHVSFVVGKVRYHAVIVDMNAGKVSVKTVLAGGSHTAWSMIGKDQPIAAITGTFFSPAEAVPVADVLVDGNLKAKGDRGSCFGVDYYGVVSIFDEHFRQPVQWANFQYGLRGAVRVVSNGKVCPDPKAQKFHDRRIWSAASRTGIGLTKGGKLVFIATSKPVTLSQFGRAMVACGIKNGLSLDGGSSTCLYYNGQMLISPRRSLTNLLLIMPRSPLTMPPIQQIAKTPPAPASTMNQITVSVQQNAPIVAPPTGNSVPTGGKRR